MYSSSRLQGAELLIVPTALGMGPVADMTPFCVVPTRALENHVFVAYSNHAYSEETGNSNNGSNSAHVDFCGRSALIGPDGKDVSRASTTDCKLLVAQFDTSQFRSDVERNPYVQVRRNELYSAISQTASNTESLPNKQQEQEQEKTEPSRL